MKPFEFRHDKSGNVHKIEHEDGIDRYFALICVHVSWVLRESDEKHGSQSFRPTVDLVIDLISRAMQNNMLLESRRHIGKPASVHLAFDCCLSTSDAPSNNEEGSDTQSIPFTFGNEIKLSATNTINDDAVCPICLEGYGQFDLVTLICSHSFHLHCVGQCFLGRCPLCRLPIPVPYIRECYTVHAEILHRCDECRCVDIADAKLLLCLSCGKVCCPPHSFQHFELEHHAYGIELGTAWGPVDASARIPNRGQRIWSHRSGCWVQRLVSDSNGIHFTEIFSEICDESPSNDLNCCHQLNALCSRFVQVLTHSMNERNEQFDQHRKRLQTNYERDYNALQTSKLKMEEFLQAKQCQF